MAKPKYVVRFTGNSLYFKGKKIYAAVRVVPHILIYAIAVCGEFGILNSTASSRSKDGSFFRNGFLTHKYEAMDSPAV